MIVSITGLAKKVLLTGSPTKFVIAIALIVQTSYRAIVIVEICFVSFKKSLVNSIQVQSLCIHEGFLTYNELLTFDNLCISHTLRG